MEEEVLAKSRRANAVMFGFEFQVNAAIVLMIENIEDLKTITSIILHHLRSGTMQRRG